MSRKSTVPTSSDNYDGLKDYLHNLVLTSEEEANIPGQLKFLYAQCAFLTSSEERQGVERLLDRVTKLLLNTEREQNVKEMSRCLNEHERFTSEPGTFVPKKESHAKKKSPKTSDDKSLSQESSLGEEINTPNPKSEEKENGASSEKRSNVGLEDTDTERKKDTKVPRQKPIPRLPPQIIEHPLQPDQQFCPNCTKPMHRAHTRSKIIVRRMKIVEERHLIHTNRCLTCDTRYDAPCPAEKEDTIGVFEIPMASLMIYLRYGNGLPSHRSQELTASLGYRIPDSTQWDVFLKASERLSDFYKFYVKYCEKSNQVQADDTYLRIIQGAETIPAPELPLGVKPKKFTPEEDRTGVHTTGIIAHFPEGVLCLYDSGLHHAGEVLEKIYHDRTDPTPIVVVGDASTCNLSRLEQLTLNFIKAFCNSHSLRKFKDLKGQKALPSSVDEILAIYQSIFKRDKELKTKKVSPANRTAAHKEHSLPCMERIKQKIEDDFATKKVEPNSQLGPAYKYFLRHYEHLTRFCHIEGVPVCNNACERLLKWAIRHRKNSNFYRTQEGANAGDTFMSLLFTAKSNNLDPLLYLTTLLQHPEKLKAEPQAFLPWNFTATLNKLNAPPQETPIYAA